MQVKHARNITLLIEWWYPFITIITTKSCGSQHADPIYVAGEKGLEKIFTNPFSPATYMGEKGLEKIFTKLALGSRILSIVGGTLSCDCFFGLK